MLGLVLFRHKLLYDICSDTFLTQLGLLSLGLAWPALVGFALVWLGLAWRGLAWPGLLWLMFSSLGLL